MMKNRGKLVKLILSKHALPRLSFASAACTNSVTWKVTLCLAGVLLSTSITCVPNFFTLLPKPPRSYSWYAPPSSSLAQEESCWVIWQTLFQVLLLNAKSTSKSVLIHNWIVDDWADLICIIKPEWAKRGTQHCNWVHLMRSSKRKTGYLKKKGSVWIDDTWWNQE